MIAKAAPLIGTPSSMTISSTGSRASSAHTPQKTRRKVWNKLKSGLGSKSVKSDDSVLSFSDSTLLTRLASKRFGRKKTG